MMKKILLVVIALTSLICTVGFSEGNTSLKDEKFSKLDFLVSKRCHDFVLAKLNEEHQSKGLKYSFSKLFDQDESFNNVEGIITLYADAKYKFIDLLKIKTKSTFPCEPNKVISFKKNEKGWASFIKRVEKLENEGIYIHSIQTDEEYIKILINHTD